MQWATGVACQTYFETLSFRVSFQNLILEQTVHVLHCLFLWSEIQWQGWQLPYQKARSIHLCYYGLEERPADVFNEHEQFSAKGQTTKHL